MSKPKIIQCLRTLLNERMLDGQCVAGLDPGKDGGVAYVTKLDGVITLRTFRMPLKNDVVDIVHLSRICSSFLPNTVYIEEAFVSPDNKFTSATIFKNWGRMAGAFEAHGCRIFPIYPTTWQARILPKSDETTKKRAFQIASQIFPDHKWETNKLGNMPDGPVDASLVAVAGILFEQEIVAKAALEKERKAKKKLAKKLAQGITGKKLKAI